MRRADLIKALRQLKIETGSFACLGCGREHNCSTQGCAIIRAAVEALEKMRWRPVEEDLPTTYEPVLISYRDDYAHPRTAMGFLSPGIEFLSVPFAGSVMSSTTHWMPLPDPPEVSEDG